MDIAALSIAMSTVSTQSAYGVAMLSKSLDQVSSMGDQITERWTPPAWSCLSIPVSVPISISGCKALPQRSPIHALSPAVLSRNRL